VKYKRRTRLEIVKELLSACQEGRSKTGIMRETNLNFRLTRNWVKRLVDSGALREVEGKYYITENGIRIIELINKYSKLLREYRELENELYKSVDLQGGKIGENGESN
jgi:predicted transcriptional regulator